MADLNRDDVAAPSVPEARWLAELQHYINMCRSDAEIFDFGPIYGVITRQKGVKAKALLLLQPLIARLLAIAPCSKVQKPELVHAVGVIVTENKHRSILPKQSRSECTRYIIAQVSHPWSKARLSWI